MRLGLPQLAMIPSLYRPRVVLHDLESCFPQNKGLRDKIELDLNFSGTIRSRRCFPKPSKDRYFLSHVHLFFLKKQEGCVPLLIIFYDLKVVSKSHNYMNESKNGKK
jgi:hypothetical protein